MIKIVTIIKKVAIPLIVTLMSCSFSQRKHVTSQKRSGNDSIILTENYIKLCYGIKTDVDTSNVMEHVIQLLNTSDYEHCLELLERSFHKLDTVRWHSGFYGLIIPDSTIRSYKTPDVNSYNSLAYLSFRYNNFKGDLANDEQLHIMGQSVNVNNPDKLYKLQYVEGFMLGYEKLRIPDTTVAKETIKAAEYLKSMYPQSMRLDYILGLSYLVLEEDAKAIVIFDRLIDQNYYALPSLKTIIKYLGDRGRLTEQEQYIRIYERMFPSECILLKKYDKLPINSLKSVCKKCIKTGSQRDSINSNIFLAQYFFKNKAWLMLDSLINIYYKEHKYAESTDSLKVYEEKVYPDLKMRELFLLKQYNKIFDYENFIHIEDAEILKDIKDYTRKLYVEYISTDTSGFDIFYKKNFTPPPRDRWGDKYETD